MCGYTHDTRDSFIGIRDIHSRISIRQHDPHLVFTIFIMQMISVISE